MAARREVSEKEARRLLAAAPGATVSGIALPVRVRWKIAHVERVRFENVDFGGAMITGRFLRRGTLSRCVLVDASLDALRCDRIDFVDCRFENVRFGKDYHGSVCHCVFRGCTFERCRLDYVEFSDSTFDQCRLMQVNAKRAMWRRCELENAVLSGRLKATNFVGTAFRRVDFTELDLDDCCVIDSPEADVAMPEKEKCFAVTPAGFLQAKAALPGCVEEETLAAYARWERTSGRTNFYIIGDAFLSFFVPRDRETVRRALYGVRTGRSRGTPA